jgi:hypothetical protein
LILDNRLCSGNIDQNLVIDSTCLAFYEYAWNCSIMQIVGLSEAL